MPPSLAAVKRHQSFSFGGQRGESSATQLGAHLDPLFTLPLMQLYLCAAGGVAKAATGSDTAEDAAEEGDDDEEEREEGGDGGSSQRRATRAGRTKRQRYNEESDASYGSQGEGFHNEMNTGVARIPFDLH